MSLKKEDVKLLFYLFVAILGTVLTVALAVNKLKKHENKSNTQVVNENFSNPDFKVGDCFLVSTPKEKLHPHYFKIAEKDLVKKKYSVIEAIGNGQNSEVAVYINYYDELKSFDKYRSSCPKFLIKN